MTAKATRGATLFDSGHNTSIDPAEKISENSSVFTAPIRSHMKPQPSRPTALLKLNPATSPAPALGDKPSECA